MNKKDNSVFGESYSSMYDLLYNNKDYKGECDFIEKIFNNHEKEVKTVLDLGCGTGRHAVLLAKRGYNMTGVDASEDMLKEARKRAADEGVDITFIQGKAQNFSLDKKFDAIISMFTVFSYLIDNEDVSKAVGLVKQHLNPEGVFVFDVFNGLRFVIQGPSDVVKEINRGGKRIVRTTRPTVDWVNHRLNLLFNVFVFNENGFEREIEEDHTLRFFYPQELKMYLTNAGFSDVSFRPLSQYDRELTEHDWFISIIGKS